MPALNPQAEESNRIIKTANPVVYELLSKKGKAAFFPAKGILAQGVAARGKEINATIGTAFEDNGDPMVLPSLAKGFELNIRDAFPYAPSEGTKPLRDKWKELIRKKTPSLGTREISTPVVSCGVTNALSTIGYMFVEEGDEIINPDLYWENYDLVFCSAFGAQFKYFNFFKNRVFDLDSFRRGIMAKPAGKKIVLLNFPNNPSGYNPTKKMGQEIIDALKDSAEAGNKLLVMLDDAYYGLNYEEDIFTESLFGQLSGAHENLLAVKLDGLTKEEYAWGLRVGFLTFGVKNGSKELYKALEDKAAGVLRGNISNSSLPAQNIFLNALKSETHEKEKLLNLEKIRVRYLKVKKTLEEHPEYEKYYEALPFNSGYFMCVYIKNRNVDKVWETLLNKYSTGVICYSEQNLLRITFAATPEAQVEKLFSNIYSACKDNA
jgi:aspartate/methionine/tyrosine aminotransferase